MKTVYPLQTKFAGGIKIVVLHGEQDKRIHYSCEDGIEKSVPRDHIFEITQQALRCQSVIFLPARPASQTHDSHKGRMILNHVNPAGRIKNCGEKSAFKNLQLSF